MSETKMETNFLQSFLISALLITVSEIGDKTFFITAIMAVKYSRLIVFLGSMAGLIANNVISSEYFMERGVFHSILHSISPSRCVHRTAIHHSHASHLGGAFSIIWTQNDL